MKAVVLREHGGLDRLQYVTDFPDPVVKDGHVVIRVKATSFNYHDVFTVRGMPGIKVPLPMIIGLDMAGEILEVGGGVTGWRPGDRVLVNPLNRQKGLMGEMMHGGLAEKCLVADHQLIRMPADVTYAEAAALPVAYGTAHRMIVTHDTIRKGEKVLVLGASGGVGTGCVLLAKMLGAEVIACASSGDKLARLKELGADHVINYKETDFSKWTIEKFGKQIAGLPQGALFETGGFEGTRGGLLAVIDANAKLRTGLEGQVRQLKRLQGQVKKLGESPSATGADRRAEPPRDVGIEAGLQRDHRAERHGHEQIGQAGQAGLLTTGGECS